MASGLQTIVPKPAGTVIEAKSLTVGYGSFVLMRDVSFTVGKGEIFFIMGGSGCGKSTLLRVLMGLKEPQGGEVTFLEKPFWPGTLADRYEARRRSGVLFQGGALWSSMTLAENVSLPLEQYTSLSQAEIRSHPENFPLMASAGVGFLHSDNISHCKPVCHYSSPFIRNPAMHHLRFTQRYNMPANQSASARRAQEIFRFL